MFLSLEVMLIGPLVAPTGTEVVIEVVVAFDTVAIIPLNLTVMGAMKLFPLMITAAPGNPVAGVKAEILGKVGDAADATVMVTSSLAILSPLSVTVSLKVYSPAVSSRTSVFFSRGLLIIH